MSAQLKVFQYNGLVKSIDLVPTEKYVVGRRNSCSVVLDDYKGISREHFEISFADGVWTLTVLSQYGSVVYNGENQNSLTLSESMNFELPPYRFEFVLEEQPQAVESAQTYSDQSNPTATAPTEINPDEAFDKTVVGQLPATPYLKSLTSEVSKRLEGHSPWTVGRDVNSSFVIDDTQVSRLQFEIIKKGINFFIKDLGSINGTTLNGTRLAPKREIPLNSGDLIQVLNHMYEFEIHDSDFSDRIDSKALVAAISQEASQPPILEAGSQVAPYVPPQPYIDGSIYGMSNESPLQRLKNADRKKLIFRVVIGVIGIIAVVAGLMGGETSTSPIVKNETKEMNPISKLTPEQQTIVKQSYTLAKNYFMQGKYASARTEVIKLKELISEYQDSEDIMKLSEEAIYLQEQKIKAEQIEIAKKEAEEKIKKQVVECRKLLTPSVTSDQIEHCLSDVLQFNPEHPDFAALRKEADDIISARAVKDAERKKYEGLVGELRGLYNVAQKTEEKVDPLKSISAYEKVVSSKLPDPSGLKHQAQRKIASIKNKMNDEGIKLSEEAEKLHTDQKIKQAILTLRKAQQINPLNTDIPDKIDIWTKELRKTTMELYQEGILEESYGNIEGGESKPGAKDKWKKIIEIDIPDGEYYKKAAIKLRKYGGL